MPRPLRACAGAHGRPGFVSAANSRQRAGHARDSATTSRHDRAPRKHLKGCAVDAGHALAPPASAQRASPPRRRHSSCPAGVRASALASFGHAASSAAMASAVAAGPPSASPSAITTRQA
mmetsp:Transcript_18764/g.71410  ORF Transcript_18764/g.71410 Transcript_18764/m.71410 type:complete len:120 (+) Transcript_18764:934-1293(+)